MHTTTHKFIETHSGAGHSQSAQDAFLARIFAIRPALWIDANVDGENICGMEDAEGLSVQSTFRGVFG